MPVEIAAAYRLGSLPGVVGLVVARVHALATDPEPVFTALLTRRLYNHHHALERTAVQRSPALMELVRVISIVDRYLYERQRVRCPAP